MLQEVIQCAPFRLAFPRALTPFEWTVVENTIAEAMAYRSGGFSTTVSTDAKAVTAAMYAQSACPNWKQSWFGPAPAVSRFAYACFGSWFAGFNQATKVQIVNDIYAGLLCRPNSPWGGCQLDHRDTPQTMWEGSEQRGRWAPNAEPCAAIRNRTVYHPLTGQEMLNLFGKLTGGQLDPTLAQAANYSGPIFRDRSFLIGIQLRKGDQDLINRLAAAQDMLQAIDAAVEEAAIIWAPGRGTSIRQMLVTGQIDQAALLTMINELMPKTIQDWTNVIPGLGQSVPQLLNQTQDIWAPFAQQFLGGSVGSSPGAQPVGMAVTDDVGSSLPPQNPLEGEQPASPAEPKGLAKVPTGYWVAGAAGAMAAVIFITRSQD